MQILSHFKELVLSEDQKQALASLQSFFEGPSQVFILKGYAGTGKTTLLKGIIEFLNDNKQSFSIMAPTGRAAKVLRDKTGHGVTIHKAIYNFDKLESINQESNEEAEHSFHYYFPLKNISEDRQILIVDESSMISSVESKHELFTFGTNILFDDLLTYAKVKTSKNKIIFVGDPAQLPPVNDSKSLALDIEHFTRHLNLGAEEVEMKDVLRQRDNLILTNAKTLRTILQQQKRSELAFQYDYTSFVRTEAIDLIEHFTNTFPNPELGDGVVISYSNSQCYHYNVAIRQKIFPDQQGVVPGDLLLINNNNYHTYGVELFNGDIAKVISVENQIISQSAPVFCDEGGIKVRKIITVDFQKIKIRIPNHSDEIECNIIHSLLHSVNRDLTIPEMKAMYINFMMRFNDEQKVRKESGLPYYKVGSEEFKQRLKNDPFFNALRVKFGYAITCHKAQGGEWNKVFVDYSGRISLKDNPIRWCYTATTRGVNIVYAANAPYFDKMAKFRITEIGKIGKLPIDTLSLDNIPLSPFHSAVMSRCKSMKFWEIKEKLESTSYAISNVESKGEFLERYTISDENMNLVLVQASHKGSGHFVENFKVINEVAEKTKTEIQKIFNSDFDHQFSIVFKPKLRILEVLHSRMQECCSELSITITNVKEGKNFVNYYLKTDSMCSYIQFYYNDNEQLTTAMPKTFDCDNDLKLASLITKLLSYAS